MSTQARSYPRQLEGKLAIVTGASRGIGAAIARNLAEKGANLVLNYTSDSSQQPTETLSKVLVEEFGVECLVVKADVGSEEGVAQLVKLTELQFTNTSSGKLQVDILINNAGVSKNTPLESVTQDDYNWQYRINVLGPLLLTQAIMPFLPHDRSGRIVNLSSVSSSLGFIGQTVYGGTKAAVEAMTRTWANELAERCTVNAVNPGPVKTDMWAGTKPEFKRQLKSYIEHTPAAAIREALDDEDLVKDAENAGGRPAYVEEIAGVVGMLCTKDASWCTGQVVCANGGMRMSI